jgi:hypothetical protein
MIPVEKLTACGRCADNSGVHDVAAGMTFRRAEGMWNSGMDVATSLRNGSHMAKGAPNPSYFNEFVGNKFEVGHRAPHLGNPWLQNRDVFWSQPVAKAMFAFGMNGQGEGHSNRFIVFRRNTVIGGNGAWIWGTGTTDVLVEGNTFNGTNISIALDHFPTNHSAVSHVVIRGNTETFKSDDDDVTAVSCTYDAHRNRIGPKHEQAKNHEVTCSTRAPEGSRKYQLRMGCRAV